jgi:type II secretory pathway predicted ATPase ExeA
MYEAFFKLKEKPFSIQPDPSFLYFSKRHRLGYAMLQYGLENRAGFSVITGDIGSGKTTLIRHLLNNIQADIRVGLISNTHPEIADLMEWVLLAFDQPYELSSKVAMYDAFQQFLVSEYAEGRRCVLIIDEAQNLNPQALEALRMLSNINADKHQLLQMVLVGQPELKALLRRPDLKQFAQRVSVDFHLEPLGTEDVTKYIAYRLQMAGAKKPIFSRRAAQRVSEASEGVPRRINVLCDTALVYAFSQDASVVDTQIIDEVIKDKKEYGVFDPLHLGSDEADLVASERVEPDPDSVLSSTKEKPALVVYDPELAAKLIDKLDK